MCNKLLNKLTEFFLGTIINLYIDYNKFKGRNVKMSIPKIKDVLENYSMQNLMELFRPTTMESNEIK